MSGKKIVLCHGVFDFPHLGHIKHFKAAKKFGADIIVRITGVCPVVDAGLIDNFIIQFKNKKLGIE